MGGSGAKTSFMNEITSAAKLQGLATDARTNANAKLASTNVLIELSRS
jgi:hypothetical protein